MSGRNSILVNILILEVALLLLMFLILTPMRDRIKRLETRLNSTSYEMCSLRSELDYNKSLEKYCMDIQLRKE